MAQKRGSDQSGRIVEAILSLADTQGWDVLSMPRIAKKAGLPLKTVERLFRDPWDILAYALRALGASAEKAGGAWRDALFDVTMSRFDAAQRHRAAFLKLPVALARNPAVLSRLAKPFGEGMRDMLKQAGAPATPLHVVLFSALYLSVVEVWRGDESPDLARTMAALDKRLGLFEKAVETLTCRSPAKAGAQRAKRNL